MLSYGIGLDIGIASVGWAVVALDNNELPYGIINMGSRIFDAAENPKDGASLALPRREARSMRRRLRRHRHRNERIRAMLVRRGILTQGSLDTLFDGQLEDIYALRVRALDQSVTAEEFGADTDTPFPAQRLPFKPQSRSVKRGRGAFIRGEQKC